MPNIGMKKRKKYKSRATNLDLSNHSRQRQFSPTPSNGRKNLPGKRNNGKNRLTISPRFQRRSSRSRFKSPAESEDPNHSEKPRNRAKKTLACRGPVAFTFRSSLETLRASLPQNTHAVVAELADAHGSGPCPLNAGGGSTPLDGTIKFQPVSSVISTIWQGLASAGSFVRLNHKPPWSRVAYGSSWKKSPVFFVSAKIYPSRLYPESTSQIQRPSVQARTRRPLSR